MFFQHGVVCYGEVMSGPDATQNGKVMGMERPIVMSWES